MNRYHCCATCQHFKAEKTADGMNYFCTRLQYETKPTYQFTCWDPKEHVRKLIQKEKQS
ncbi:hypothetical protein [Priestia koreensis]|uniref:hypothetical protein n=1 Tax=Priestia koreensis TaxID=284581 RepID=UPI001F5833C5|nr:hypothetical protein [Priestia koreensis]UNL83592.1 hypothetical protein IE339_15655 [Priestia koreensis]